MDWHHLISLLWWLTGVQASVIRTNVTRDTRQPLPPQARPGRGPWSLELSETPSVDGQTSDSTDRQASTYSDQLIDPLVAVRVTTLIESSATHQIPAALSNIQPHTTGTVSGKSRLPNISIPAPATLVEPTATATSVTTPSMASTMASRDIFAAPIDTKAPPPCIAVRNDHPVPRKGIQSQAPLQTNKFYSNFFLGDQLGPTYTFPYSVQWAGGKGASASWGMSCSHIEAHQRVLGPEKHNGAASYFLSPVGIQSMVISAKELGNGTMLSTDSITAFSARVSLSRDGSSPPAISFPIIQGMAYITAQFDGATPVLQSGVYFKTVSRITRDPKDHVAKYTFNLEDGTTWRVYAWRTKGDELDLKVINNGVAESQKPFHGIIQICKDPGSPGSEGLLDDGAGIYPVTLKLSGSASGSKGTYCFKFQKEGHQVGHLYMYALPHHVQSFSPETKQRIQKVQLQSTTKGLATLVMGADWTMMEPNMPVDMGFSPWHPEKGSIDHLSDHAKSNIRAAAAKEVSQNMVAQSNVDSMYFSGKVGQPPAG